MNLNHQPKMQVLVIVLNRAVFDLDGRVQIVQKIMAKLRSGYL